MTSRTHPRTSSQLSPFQNLTRVALSARFLRLAAVLYCTLMVLVWATLIMLWLGGAHGRDAAGEVLGPDFPAFYTGGTLIRTGQLDRLYDLSAQQALQQALFNHDALSAFINPPYYALLLAPLSALSYPAAFAIWTLLMLLAFGASVGLLRSILPSLHGRDGRLLVALALLSGPLYFAISAGQNTGLSLLLHVVVLVALVRRRDGLAGAMLAIGMYKPHLFIGLVPLLLLARRWRALAGFAAGSALIGGVTLATFGWTSIMSWLDVLRSPIFQAEEIRQSARMFSIRAFWSLLIGPGAAATALTLVCAALIAIGLAWLWWRRPVDLSLLYAATLCGLLLFGSHLPIYDLGLLILPGLVIAERLLRTRSDAWRTLRLCLLALFVLVLFAVQYSAVWVLLIVPLIGAIGVLSARMLLSSADESPATI